jgi:hypothetical protein
VQFSTFNLQFAIDAGIGNRQSAIPRVAFGRHFLLDSLMTSEMWERQFKEVYQRGVAAWHDGRQIPGSMFATGDAAFLASMGCTCQELFDFIEDEQNYGEPDFATMKEIQAIRRDYFLNTLGGRYSGQIAAMESLPAKTDAVDGIAWLPRLIEKARLKLRGEMPDDLMYGCAGDRPFLKGVNMTLPQFLVLVRDSGPDNHRIVEAVKRNRGSAA